MSQRSVDMTIQVYSDKVVLRNATTSCCSRKRWYQKASAQSRIAVAFEQAQKKRGARLRRVRISRI